MKPETQQSDALKNLALITQMIAQAKGNVQRNSFHYLLWGWVTIFANLAMFVFYKLNYPYPYAVWLITIPTWGLSFYKGFRNGESSSTTTHLDRISSALWICFGISLFTIIGFGHKINYEIPALVLLVCCIPTFVSGMILKFTPLKIGGLCFWLGGIVCFLISSEYQPLVSATAISFGYLIPGYLLRKNFNDTPSHT